MATATAGERRQALAGLCTDYTSKRHVIVASNRGPVAFTARPDGRVLARTEGSRPPALSHLAGTLPLTWVSASTGEGDRLAQEAVGDAPITDRALPSGWCARFVVPPRRVLHRHYNVICNPLLWFLHHRVWSPTHTPNIDESVVDGWDRGYVPVNEMFASTVVSETARAGKPAAVLFRDFHLYLAPALVRRSLPDAALHHTIEVPWPGPDAWEVLPGPWRTAVLQGLLSNDVIALPGERDRRAFIACVEEFLPAAEIDRASARICTPGQETALRVSPGAVDIESLERIMRSPRVADNARMLQRGGIDHTFVRIDRAEPHKNIVRTIRAFGLLLRERADLMGKVRLLLLLAPPPPHLSQYRRYTDEIAEAAKTVNRECGRSGWTPVELELANDYPKAMAALTIYDTLIVNPIADAHAASAREGSVLNRRDGLLILSDSAAPWEQLREWSLTVAATDVSGLAAAMGRAVDMPHEQRSALAAGLRKAALQEDAAGAASRLLSDLLGVSEAR